MNEILSAPANMSGHIKEVIDGCYDIPELNFENPTNLTGIPKILDLGANVGSFAAWAAKRWPGAEIQCYEPHEGNFDLLRENVGRQATLHHLAVSNMAGVATLYNGAHNCGEASLVDVRSSDNKITQQVNVISGSDLPPADILKLDTEGSEWEILSTYRYLANVTAVMFEWHRPEDKKKICELLESNGLSCYQERNTEFYDRGLMKFARGMKYPGVKACDISLLIACPCYGGQTYWTHNTSVISLILELQKSGVDHELHYLPNESLIPRARNRFGTLTLNGNGAKQYTHLLFLDVDIGFQAKDIVSMIALDKDIVALPYSAKDFDWAKIVKAVKSGVSDPETLKHIAGRPIINADKETHFSLTEAVEFPQLGTGVLLIKKRVFEGLAKDESRKYRLMNNEKSEIMGQEYAYEFFRSGIDPETRYFLSEDYAFCVDARRAGFETWLWPNAITTHTGNYQFTMDIGAQAQLDIDLTANTEETVAVSSPAPCSPPKHKAIRR